MKIRKSENRKKKGNYGFHRAISRYFGKAHLMSINVSEGDGVVFVSAGGISRPRGVVLHIKRT